MCPLSGTGGSLAGARGPVIDCLRVCGETRLSGNASEACKHRSAGWDEPSHFAGLCNECNRGLSCQGAFILKGDISPPVSCRLYRNLQVVWSTCMCISCAAIRSAYLADKSRYLCMCLPIFHSSQKPFPCRPPYHHILNKLPCWLFKEMQVQETSILAFLLLCVGLTCVSTPVNISSDFAIVFLLFCTLCHSATVLDWRWLDYLIIYQH